MPLAEQRGGAELMLRHLVEQSQEVRDEWIVAFLEDGPMVAELSALGVQTTAINAGRLRQAHRWAATIASIARLLRREAAEVAVGWMGKGQLYGGPASRVASVPALWYQLGVPTRTGWMDRMATALPCRGVINVSATAAAAQGRLWPHRPCATVVPGVEIDRFRAESLPPPGEVRRRLGLPASGPVVGIVGRLQRWKGMHVLIEALPAIRASHPDAHCVVVGGAHALEPDYAGFLERRVDDLGLRAHVTLAGQRPNVPEWMQAMDVIVHASDDEPFGIVVIEAMALGKPVVAGDRAGPTEIVRAGVDGLLAPYGHPRLLAEAVLRYLDDPQFAARMAAAARERAQEFSTARYANAFTSAVRELLGHHPSGISSR